MVRFEYPPGSGRSALYDDYEAELMRAFARALDAGWIGREEFRNQVRLVHEAKMLGYRIRDG